MTGCGSERSRGTSAGDVRLCGKTGLDRAEPFGVRRFAVAAEVQARTEAATGAREDDDPAVAVTGDRVEGAVEVSHELGVHRVQPLWAVQRDPSDPSLGAVDEQR